MNGSHIKDVSAHWPSCVFGGQRLGFVCMAWLVCFLTLPARHCKARGATLLPTAISVSPTPASCPQVAVGFTMETLLGSRRMGVLPAV